MSVVKSNSVYSPQNFVEKLTGRTYVFHSDNDIKAIHSLLRQNGVETEDNPLWDYSLDEIDHLVESNIPVVLVTTLHWDEDHGAMVHELRWFEVPEEFAK